MVLNYKESQEEQNSGMASERSFGLTFFIVFSLISIWPFWTGGDIRWWSLIIGVFLLIITFTRPVILMLPNRVWFKIGIILGNIVAPLTMAIVFFLVVVPTGMILKIFGKDPLQEKLDSRATTYWINKDLEGNQSDSMKNQF